MESLEVEHWMGIAYASWIFWVNLLKVCPDWHSDILVLCQSLEKHIVPLGCGNQGTLDFDAELVGQAVLKRLVVQDCRMERTCKNWALNCHAQSFSADGRPDWVELPNLLIRYEPFFLMFDLCPLNFSIEVLFSKFDESKNVNLILSCVMRHCNKFSKLVLRNYLGIGAKICALFDIIFQVILSLVFLG